MFSHEKQHGFPSLFPCDLNHRSYMTGPRKLPMIGRIVSPNCGFVMNVSVSALVVDKHRLERKAIQYSMLVRRGWAVRVG